MAAKQPVLLVDDDDALREVLVDHLADDGEFAATSVASVQEAEVKLAQEDAQFNAIILDIGLPTGDGRDLCARLRRKGYRMPIIMLTGSDDGVDVVRDLDAGADNYITQPVRPTELLARLRVQLHTFENSDAMFIIGPYTFRPAAKLLQEPTKNLRIYLTEKEVTILKSLYRAGNQRVTRQVLQNEVWGFNATIAPHTLVTHIYHLRQKIEPEPGNARLLITEDGGYRLDPEGLSELRVQAPIFRLADKPNAADWPAESEAAD